MNQYALFKNIREEVGLSQSRLAMLSGYDHSYVSRIEKGSRDPTREALECFLSAMGLVGDERWYELMNAFGYVTDRHILADDLLIRVNAQRVIDPNFELSLYHLLGEYHA